RQTAAAQRTLFAAPACPCSAWLLCFTPGDLMRLPGRQRRSGREPPRIRRLRSHGWHPRSSNPAVRAKPAMILRFSMATCAPPLPDTIDHRHDDNTVTFVVYRHPKVTVVGPGDGAHPRIGLVVPGVVSLLRLVVYFDKGLPLVELSEQIKELRPGECLGGKAPADIHNAAHDWDVTGREVHPYLSVCDARQFLFHLIPVPVPHDVVEHHI